MIGPQIALTGALVLFACFMVANWPRKKEPPEWFKLAVGALAIASLIATFVGLLVAIWSQWRVA